MTTDNASGAGMALPPLPERYRGSQAEVNGHPLRLFAAHQMQDYARAAILADRARQAPAPVEANCRYGVLSEIATFFNIDYNDLVEVVDDWEKSNPEPPLCQCPSCVGGTIHASDCSVHNIPAMPNGPCDCGALPPSVSYPPCKGENCGATDGASHSAECFAEHAAIVDAVASAPVEVSRLAEEAKARAKNAATLPRDPGPRQMQLDACFAIIDRLASMASTPVGEVPAGQLTDKQRLDWLDAAAVDMLLEFGFEMEGGVYLRIDAPGHGGTDIREKNSARQLIDSAMQVAPC